MIPGRIGYSVSYFFVSIIIIALYYLWICLFYSNSARDIGMAVFAALGPAWSSIYIYRSNRNISNGQSTFWNMLFLCLLFYTAGELLWFQNEAFQHKVQGRPVFYILSLICAFIGVLHLVYKKKNLYRMFQVFIDSCVVMIVALTFGWIYIINPILNLNNLNEIIISLVIVILLFLLLLASITMIFIPRVFSSPKVLILCITGLIFLLIMNIILLHSIIEQYEITLFIYPLWTFSTLLIGAAAVLDSEILSVKVKRALADEDSFILMRLRLFLPYASLFLLIIPSVTRRDELLPVIIAGSLALILITIRQVFNMRENENLLRKLVQMNQSLEKAVEHRTMELSKTNAELRRLAYHDPLTGLANRRFLLEQLPILIKDVQVKSNKLAVVFLDLDHFKKINDTLGHDVGDQLLCDVAQEIKKCLQPEDFLARQGGDEFIIILNNIKDRNDIHVKVTCIQEALKSSEFFKRFGINLTISMGISVFPDDGEDQGQLMKFADQALYLVKQNGKNNHAFFDTELNNAVTRKVYLEKSLNKALTLGEFSLVYQPQIDIKSGIVCGAEALLRWNHSLIGSVSPSEFIPLAEETGLIIPIGEWVIEEVWRQTLSWKTTYGYIPRISINLSIKQLENNRIRDILLKKKEEFGDISCFDLEITESVAAVFGEEELSEIIIELKALGVTVSIDDFGTGYSSLSYLKNLPIDKLKIDRSFVNDTNRDSREARIIQSIIDLSKSLGVKVLIEGVEREDQLEFLLQTDCDEIQGFLFSKPLPAVNFEEKFLKNKDAISGDALGSNTIPLM